uniref:Uncharacterized protein n=1 Tax=Anguilla anguilla TaxID=7936 RepID=A0A0E9RZ57_ANGAN
MGVLCLGQLLNLSLVNWTGSRHRP